MGVLIVYLLFKDQQFPEFIKDLKNANWIWAFLSAVLILISHFFRALRWQLMIIPIATQKPKLLHAFNALMIGYLANLVIPRAGEIARCAVLSKKENIKVTALIGTVIAERIIDLMMLFLLIIISFFLYADLIVSFIKEFNLYAFISTDKLIWIGLIILFSIIIILLFRHFGSNSTLYKKLSEIGIQLKEGVLSIQKVNKPILFFFYTAIIWIFYILSSLICFKVLQETSFLDVSAALLTVIAGSFGMIAPIQGGIGAYHFMVTETLALLNIDKKAGLEFATIIHASQTIAVIIFGLFALILEINFKTIPHEPKQSDHTT
jgi:uncharacterized protein (TIRG00374 family)